MNVKYIFDGTKGKFNMDPLPISLQLMYPNCKPIHAHAYTVPRSVEQQLQQCKEIVRLVDIGVLEKTIHLSGLLHNFQFLRKTEQ
jgi:hypothetical protein